MTREQILEDIRTTLGIVPDEFNQLPDNILEHEWMEAKLIEFRETRIPLKYKHLIGLAAASILGNHRLCFAQRELAKHFGASDEEIIETLNISRRNAGRSAFISGAGIELENYRKEITQIVQNLRQKKAA